MTASTQISKQESGAKKALKYALLPGIIPRAKALGGSGFGYLAFLIARVYQGVRILPPTHAYTNPSNIGKFGIRHVIGEAANHIKLSRNNIDQIIIFFAILAAMFLMVMQFVALIYLIFSGQAFAQDVPAATGDFAGIFATQNPDRDIAFMLLDHVFGIPDFFGSEAPTGTSFHVALQTLFQFYNLSILIVAVLVFLYYVVVVIAETAQSGTPFGKRFSHIYAPLRLVAALGLLVPLNYGLNASQYITLFAARMGSGMATNGWIIFNRELTNPVGVDKASLIAEPNIPNVYGMVEFMSVVNTCREMYRTQELPFGREIKPYVITGEGNPLELSSGIYNEAVERSGGGDIEIVFGELVALDNGTPQQTVEPFCGTLIIPVNVRELGSINLTGDAAPERMQEYYLRVISWLWQSSYLKFLAMRTTYARDGVRETLPCDVGALAGEPGSGETDPNTSAPCSTGDYLPPVSFKESLVNSVTSLVSAHAQQVISQVRENIDLSVKQEILERGWGGAGIWYNEIARANGALIVAISNLPTVKKYPTIMEFVKSEHEKQDGRVQECKKFTPHFSNNMPAKFANSEIDKRYAVAMAETFEFWRCDTAVQEKAEFTGNIFVDVLNVMLGTHGLFDIWKNSGKGEEDGIKVHPLAQLVAIGKGMVDSSIKNLGNASISAFGGGVASILGPHSGATLGAMSGFLVSLATIGLAAGFLMYYVLPFLPFIYFFFAVGSWVKTIFEAMVGAPLWALAHLRIDGDGFMGKSAINGYFLVFEIFVRPILTVFGLIGGMAVFTALAVILNEVFGLVVSNVTGTDINTGAGAGTVYMDEEIELSRGVIDQFFFTIVYAVLLYMMGTSSFKMIDLVPNNILRWLGASVSSFGDQGQDPTQGLGQYAAFGGATIGGQLAGGITQMSRGAGEAGVGIVDAATQKK